MRLSAISSVTLTLSYILTAASYGPSGPYLITSIDFIYLKRSDICIYVYIYKLILGIVKDFSNPKLIPIFREKSPRFNNNRNIEMRFEVNGIVLLDVLAKST